MRKPPVMIPATMEHLEHVCKNVRKEDEAEFEAMGFDNVMMGASYSFNASKDKWVWLHNGVPACVFGVIPGSVLDNKGYPWVISTPEVEKAPFTFTHWSREVMRTLLDQYGELTMDVDCRYKKCVAWVEWMGFEKKAMVQYAVPFFRYGIKA